MSILSYPKYMDSGVEWLGPVPAHWIKTALKYLGNYQNGYPFKPEDWGSEGIPIVRIAQLTGDDEPNFYAGTLDHRVLVENGDLLFSWSANIDSFIWGKGPAWLNQHIFKVTTSSEANKKFLFYVIKHVAPKLAEFDAHGSTMRHIKKESLGERVFVPPVSEQLVIANFLDKETAKIDALIAEQQRLIELLKQKRQSVISQAVTKGLNPNAPMMNSGVEWLGEVPAHWEVKRLKHISPFITVGVVVNPSTFLADAGFPFIYGGDIREGVIDWENSRRIDAESSEANSKTRLKAGDLLTVRVGAPGVTAVVPIECEGGNCASVMLVRKGLFNSHWLCYAMNTRIVRFQVEIVQYGAAQEQFNISHAVNFWAPTPPRAEQDEIVEFLDRVTAKLDTLTTEAQRGIDLLQERRAALISAAVTGKIDVRAAA